MDNRILGAQDASGTPNGLSPDKLNHNVIGKIKIMREVRKNLNESGQCRLCLQLNKLCRSHIIPEFFYERLYTEKHKFLAIPSDENTRIIKLQKGLYEQLLCEKCESQICEYERYSRDFL